jgi:undecaprenyl-diphosphatase
LDEYLLLFINQTLSNNWLDVFFAWISQSLFFSVPLLLSVMVFLSWRFGKDGFNFWLLTIVFIVLGDQLGALLKYLIAQPRPCAELGEIVRQTDTLFSINCSRHLNGMPSNHALNFFLFMTFSSYVLRWRGWALGFGLLAILVALSRVYLGVHYPSQILVGALIGASVGAGTGWLSVRHLPFVQRVMQLAEKS